VQSLKVNGKPWNQAWIGHADIAAGATLEFEMGSKPSAWGSAARALPASLTAAGAQPAGMHDLSGRAASVVLEGQATAAALVDDDAATALALPARAAVSFAFADAAKASYYTITSGKAALQGLGWTLEGRNGNGGWIALDRRSGESFAWARQLRPFRIAKPGAYRAYRLRFENGSAIELAELELLEQRTNTATAGALTK
jgi:hypothetical protein